MADENGEEPKRPLSKHIDDNLRILKDELGVGISFDALVREFEIGGVRVALVFIDGFADSMLLSHIMSFLMLSEREEVRPRPLQKILSAKLPHVEVDTTNTIDDVLTQVLSGPQVLLIDGEVDALVIDARSYPDRNPEESDIEKVTRGSRDSFVETMIWSVTLIRRRLRDPRLRTEYVSIGKRSKTDVIIMYIQDIAHPELVESVKSRLERIDLDGIPMAEKTIEEFIVNQNWNPFPQVRYTERPDVAAIHLLEGHVLILADTSPSALIVPVTLFHHLQHAEEYRQNVTVGLYLRLVRLLGILASVFVPPLWLLISFNPEVLPPALKFLGPEKTGDVPLLLQFLIATVGIDLIRLATIHTPSPVATSLGFIGAVLIGDVAVRVGLFVPEVLLYVSVAIVGVFATPSYELSVAIRTISIFLLLAAGLFGPIGFLLATLLVVLRAAKTKSFGVPYLWPLIPLNLRALGKALIRHPVPVNKRRPGFLKPQDPTRTSGDA